MDQFLEHLYPATIRQIILDLYIQLYHGEDKKIIKPLLLKAVNLYLKYNIPAKWLWPVIVYLQKEGMEVQLPESKIEYFDESLKWTVTEDNFPKEISDYINNTGYIFSYDCIRPLYK